MSEIALMSLRYLPASALGLSAIAILLGFESTNAASASARKGTAGQAIRCMSSRYDGTPTPAFHSYQRRVRSPEETGRKRRNIALTTIRWTSSATCSGARYHGQGQSMRSGLLACGISQTYM